MTTSCFSFPAPGEAADAVERLVAAGIPTSEVRVLMAARVHDPVSEPAGAYGGDEVTPEAPVGRFAGAPLRRDQAMGAYAGNATRGRPERSRRSTARRSRATRG